MRRVILIGYSFGADVVPFLSSTAKCTIADLRLVALLGLSETAEFEFPRVDWIVRRGSSSTERTRAERFLFRCSVCEARTKRIRRASI